MVPLALLWLVIPTSATAQVPAEPPTPSPTTAAGLTVRGFGNVDYVTQVSGSAHNEFRNGALDIYATSQISGRCRALVELVFEGEDGESIADLERLQFSFEHSNLIQLDVGRVHNPLILWNTLHHHGLFLQTPAGRPLLTRWEDDHGLWPAHFVGLLLSGRYGHNWHLKYDIGIGNGRGRTLDVVQVSSDAHSSKAVVAALSVAPGFTRGLEFRVAGYFDEIPARMGELQERDVVFSSAYIIRGLEARAEWGHMRHSRAGHAFRSTEWYACVSHRLPNPWASLRPYVVLEDSRPDAALELFAGFPDQSAWSAGVRWDLDDWVALKGEFDHVTVTESGSSPGGLERQPTEPGLRQAPGVRRNEETVRLQLAVSF